MSENLPRALPVGLGGALHPDSWEIPKVFTFLAERADIPGVDMDATFNMGVGMVLVVADDALPEVLDVLGEARAVEIGRVREGSGIWLS
jgi:phosphoribosylformylglycinamidine cyclo-ligase